MKSQTAVMPKSALAKCVAVYIRLVGSWLAFRLWIFEVFWIIRDLSPAFTTRWPTTVGKQIYHSYATKCTIFSSTMSLDTYE